MASQNRYFDHDAKSERHALSFLSGSIPFITISGIRLRIHFSMLLFAAIMLLPGSIGTFPFAHRITILAMLFLMVLLHELAHASIAGKAGAKPEEIILWPLGRLNEIPHARRQGITYLTLLAGPLFTAVACALSAGVLYLMYHRVVPFNPQTSFIAPFSALQTGFYLWYAFVAGYFVLVMNLLPVFPLDGGQFLRHFLWPLMGYSRSLLVACSASIVAAIVLGIYGFIAGLWLITLIMAMCLLFCIQCRFRIKSAGTWTFDELEMEPHRPIPARHHKLSRYRKWRTRRQIHREEVDQVRLDEILAKLHTHGMHSLSWGEKRVLRRATERQREQAM